MKTNKWIDGFERAQAWPKKVRRSTMSLACCYDFAINDFAFLCVLCVLLRLNQFGLWKGGVAVSRCHRIIAIQRRLPIANYRPQKGTNLHPTPFITNSSTVKPFLSGAPLPTSGGKNRMNGKEVDT